MAISIKPDEQIIAFRFDDGPWMFDERLLKLWVVVEDVTEQPLDSGTTAIKELLNALGISRNGHSKNGNLLKNN